MSLERAQWRAFARNERALLLDYLVAAALACIVLGVAGPLFAGIAGALFGSLLGMRIGGEPNLYGTWEFLLTRPVERRRLAWIRIKLGLKPLAALLAIIVACDVFSVHERFFALLVEGTEIRAIAADAWRMRFIDYGWALTAVLLVYLIAFQMAQSELRADRVSATRAAACIVGAIVIAVVRSLSTVLARFVSPPLAHASGVALVLVCAVVVAFIIVGNLRLLELSGTRNAGTRASPIMAFAVVLVGLVLLGNLFLARTVEPETRTRTQTPSNPDVRPALEGGEQKC